MNLEFLALVGSISAILTNVMSGSFLLFCGLILINKIATGESSKIEARFGEIWTYFFILFNTFDMP